MNEHALDQLIDDVEDVASEDVTLSAAMAFFDTHAAEIVEALRELKTRRKASGDPDGLKVPE